MHAANLLAAGAGLCLLVATFVSTEPPARSADTPLLWDQSYHVLRSTQIAQTIRAGDVVGFVDQLDTWSIYPPGYYVAFGFWTACLGASSSSIFLFQLSLVLLTWVAILWLVAQVGALQPGGILVSAALLAGLAHYQALSHSFMLDAPAATATILALATLAYAWRRPRPTILIALILALTASTLVKYNTGLPAIAVTAVLATTDLWCRRWRRGAALALVTGCSLAGWALFLTWQDHGWESFLRFTENRSNSADWSASYRLVRYTGLFVRSNLDGALQGALLLGLALIALKSWRRAVVTVLALYLIFAIGSISFHSYFQSRTTVTIGIGGIALASVGVAGLERAVRRAAWPGRSTRWPGVAESVLMAAIAVAFYAGADYRIRSHEVRHFPPQNLRLQRLSQDVQDQLAAQPRVRVVGTFNNFSNPWVQLLWLRAGHGSLAGLGFDLSPPVRSRTSIPSESHPLYRERLDDWLSRQPESMVLALRPHAGSPWIDGDYKLWNAWKLNYVRAFEEHPHVPQDFIRKYEREGIDVLCFRPSKTGGLVADSAANEN